MDIATFKSTLGSPARAYKWQVIIGGLNAGDVNVLSSAIGPVQAIGAVDQAGAAAANVQSELLRYMAESTQTPEEDTNMVSVPFQGFPDIVFPAKPRLSHTWSCTFRESESGSILQELHRLHQMASDRQSGLGRPDYWFTTILQQLRFEDDVPFHEYQLNRTWVKTVGTAQLDQNADQRIVTYQATFAYDDWKLRY